MRALVKGDVLFPMSNQPWIDLRSYEWWSSATTGSSISSWEIGHSMNLGHSKSTSTLDFGAYQRAAVFFFQNLRPRPRLFIKEAGIIFINRRVSQFFCLYLQSKSSSGSHPRVSSTVVKSRLFNCKIYSIIHGYRRGSGPAHSLAKTCS